MRFSWERSMSTWSSYSRKTVFYTSALKEGQTLPQQGKTRHPGTVLCGKRWGGSISPASSPTGEVHSGWAASLSHATQQEAAISPSWERKHSGKARANGRLFISQSGIFLTRSTPWEQKPAPRQILGLWPPPTWANVPGRKSSKGCSSSTRKKQSE